MFISLIKGSQKALGRKKVMFHRGLEVSWCTEGGDEQGHMPHWWGTIVWDEIGQNSEFSSLLIPGTWLRHGDQHILFEKCWPLIGPEPHSVAQALSLAWSCTHPEENLLQITTNALDRLTRDLFGDLAHSIHHGDHTQCLRASCSQCWKSSLSLLSNMVALATCGYREFEMGVVRLEDEFYILFHFSETATCGRWAGQVHIPAWSWAVSSRRD